MLPARNERIDDLYLEPLAGDPTEEGQVRHRGGDIVALLGGVVKSLTGLPVPTAIGQALFSLDGTSFTSVQPIISCDGWLSNDCELLVEGLGE